jgi:hypothetical protein
VGDTPDEAGSGLRLARSRDAVAPENGDVANVLAAVFPPVGEFDETGPIEGTGEAGTVVRGLERAPWLA